MGYLYAHQGYDNHTTRLLRTWGWPQVLPCSRALNAVAAHFLKSPASVTSATCKMAR